MCLPALRFLKQNLPSVRLFMAAKQYLCAVYQSLEEIDTLIPLPDGSGFKSTFLGAKRLRAYDFDYGLLFTNSFHSAFLFKLAGIKNVTGYVKDLRGWLLRHRFKYPHDNRHHIYFYLELAEQFTAALSGRAAETSPSIPGIQLKITGPEKDEALARLKAMSVDLSKPFLGISPSAAFGTAKEWIPERFRELIRQIRGEKSLSEPEILLFGSAGEREKISRITQGIDSSGVHNLAGQLSLRQVMAVISCCRLFIGNDSGLMHIAAGLNLPPVALFGPTKPHKTRPLQEKARVLYHPVPCSPCLNRECPLKQDHHACMKAITVDEVFEAVFSLGPFGPPASLASLHASRGKNG
jgi:heptosyltransferase II